MVVTVAKAVEKKNKINPSSYKFKLKIPVQNIGDFPCQTNQNCNPPLPFQNFETYLINKTFVV